MRALSLGLLSLLLSLAGAARAQPCPDIATATATALDWYQQAELPAAREAIAHGYAALACQTQVVPTRQLLELYRIDALVALSLDDSKTLIFATIRAVAAQHDGGRPPDVYGPDLQSLYDTWSARLSSDLRTIRISDEGAAWIDGRPVDADHPLVVAPGEHLVQIATSSDPMAPVRSEVRELSEDTVLTTGIGAVRPVPVPLPDPELVPLPEPVFPVPLPDPLPPPVARRHPVALGLAGTVTGALAAATLASAFRSERLFLSSPYLANAFGPCARGEPCYPNARQRAIRADATKIDAAYGIGYGLSAVSGGLLVVTAIGLPARER